MRNSSYSFMPILSKLYRCFSHGLKICMWFGYYPEIIFCHFFRNLNLVIFRRFYYQSEKIVGTLCAQLLLQFYIDSFETSQVFCTWSEDMHVVWIYSSDYFLTLFPPVELSHFSDIFTTVKTLYNVILYNRIFNIRHKIAGNGSVSIKTPSL